MRKILLSTLAAALLISAAPTAALADWHDGHGERHEEFHRDNAWRHDHWEHVRYVPAPRYYYPSYYASPVPVYYVPAPQPFFSFFW